MVRSRSSSAVTASPKRRRSFRSSTRGHVRFLPTPDTTSTAQVTIKLSSETATDSCALAPEIVTIRHRERPEAEQHGVMVNSPSTSARVRNAALAIDVRRLGRMGPEHHGGPTRAEIASGLDQCVWTSMARRPASSER